MNGPRSGETNEFSHQFGKSERGKRQGIAQLGFALFLPRHLQFYSEEIFEDSFEYRPFELRNSLEREILRLDPLVLGKLSDVRVEIDSVLFAVVVAEKISLHLSAELFLFEVAVWKLVSVSGPCCSDFVFVRPDSNFLLHFTIESPDEVFSLVDSALGELPTALVANSLGNQDFSALRFAENRSYVGSIGGHTVGSGGGIAKADDQV